MEGSLGKYDSQEMKKVVELMIANDPERFATEMESEINANQIVYGRDGTRLLHEAARLDADKIAQYLIEHGADIDAKDFYAATPLGLAVRNGNAASTAVLIENGADASLPIIAFIPLLHTACGFGHLKVVRVLVSAGLDVNEKESLGGTTPLHAAASACAALADDAEEEFKKYIEIIDYLLLEGARINEASVNLEKPMDIADRGINKKLVEHLTKRGGRATPEKRMELAIYQNDVEEFKRNVYAGFNPNVVVNHATTRTLLETAAGLNREEFCEIMISHGADIELRNAFGLTPLQVCAFNSAVEAGRLLIHRGADITAVTDRGLTALHLAIAGESLATPENRQAMAELLIQHGAQVDARMSDGKTPVDLARERGYDHIVQLLEWAADPSSTQFGNSALARRKVDPVTGLDLDSMEGMHQNYELAVQSGRRSIQAAREIDALYPGAKHFITYYSGAMGKPSWNSEIGLHGRYILTMQCQIELNPSRQEIIDSSDYKFHLVEVKSVQGSSEKGYSVSYGNTQLSFGLSEWSRLVDTGGDLTALGVEIDTDTPVELFDEIWESS